MNAEPVAGLRRDARHRHLRQPVHAARLLLQDLHPAAPAVAAVREVPPQRGRPRQAPRTPGRSRVADRVPPPPRRRARHRRRCRRDRRRSARSRDGRRRRPRRRRPRARRAACSPGRAPPSARALAERVRAAGVEVLAPAAALGFFDGIVPVWCGDTLHQVRAERHIAATGSIEQPLMFEGNDLPGVMLCSGAERLANLYGVRPGGTAVIATTGDRGLESALALEARRGRDRRRRRRRAASGAGEALIANCAGPGSGCCAAPPSSGRSAASR